MTISDKIRIYELSRDLNLENKDILDAAQKLSISVKSHSSSITSEDAKKIKNLINKKKSDKKILSINKPAIRKDSPKQNIKDKSPLIASIKSKPVKDNLNKKPLLIKPLNKPESPKIAANQPKNLDKPSLVNSSQSQKTLSNQNSNNKPSHNLNQDKKNFWNNTTPPIKTPAKPPIQLIEKPRNFNNTKSNETTKNPSKSGDKRQQSSKSDQNSNKLKTKSSYNRVNTPELVGAPIRRDDPKINPYKQNSNNKQNISFKQTNPNRPSSPNRPGMANKSGLRNKPGDQVRSSSFNKPARNLRPGMPNKPGGNFRPGAPNRPGMPNRPGSKFNSQKPSGIRKPVSPNELLQLQKTNKPDQEKQVKNNNEKQNIELSKQKVKAPNTRPSSAPSSKKQPHRTFSNSSKKPGRSDWDDSAKLEALRNKNPHKQRQKVHIIGENEDSLTSETSGYSGEKISILSASLARPKKEKSDESKSQKSIKQFKKKKKETTRQRQKRRAMELKAAKEAKQVRPEMIIVPEDNLTVQELADKLSLESSEIIKSLFFKGITATVTQSLDLATIETVAEEFGVPVLQDDVQEAAEKTVDMIESDDIDNLIKRPPVITVITGGLFIRLSMSSDSIISTVFSAASCISSCKTGTPNSSATVSIVARSSD